MLEKIDGVALVAKLRAILLIEADFNFHNKLILVQRMMELARQHGMVPEEVYSEEGKTAEDAILHQVLIYDLARQLQRPLLVSLVDASQCYDRIAHAMAALTLRAYKVHQSSVLAMLHPIQTWNIVCVQASGNLKPSSEGKERTCKAPAKATEVLRQLGSKSAPS